MKKIFVLIITYFLFMSCIYAGGTFSVNSSTKNVAPKSKFSITIKSNGIGRVNISVQNGSASEKSVWIEENSKKITITSGSSGSVTITITAQEGFSDADGNQYNPGTKRIVVPIVEKQSVNTTSKKTSTMENKTTTTRKIKIDFNGESIELVPLKNIDSNFKKDKVSIDDINYDTMFINDDTVLIMDKEENYYFYDTKDKKVIDEVLPYKNGSNIYYIKMSLDDNNDYSKKEIELLKKQIDAYIIREGYYLIKAWNYDGKLLEYIYDEKEDALQLFNKKLYTCDSSEEVKGHDSDYFKYVIVFVISMLLGVILTLLFRRK